MKNFKSFFKYLKCKLGWTGSVPANVGTHSTHRCIYTSTKATTCMFHILGRTWGVPGRERRNNPCMKQVNKHIKPRIKLCYISSLTKTTKMQGNKE
jgi:hypothetical protein